jgi:hypothetical protein
LFVNVFSIIIYSFQEVASTPQTTSSSKEARIVELEKQMRDSDERSMSLEFDNGTLATLNEELKSINSALETDNDLLRAEKAVLQARADECQLALRRLGLSMASASIEALQKLEASKASEGPSQQSRLSGLSDDQILRILQSLA